jgi:hypothetical protein
MSVRTLQAIVGIFLVLIGIMGISPTINEGIFSINNGRYFVEVIFGIAELICGGIMLFGLFSYVRRNTMYKACIIVFFFWVARVVFSMLIWGLPGVFTLGTLLTWLLLLCVDALIASTIWLLASTYRK